jgi:ribonuclease HI
VSGLAVYSDATWSGGVAGIGVVLIKDGCVSDRTSTVAFVDSNTEAELCAALLAMELYPDAILHTDCQGVASRLKAVWIPRHKNGEAHRTAKIALQKLSASPITKTVKRKKKFRFRGRGVVSLDEKRMSFN